MWRVTSLLYLSAFLKIETLGARSVHFELILVFCWWFGRYTISWWGSGNMWHSIASLDMHFPGDGVDRSSYTGLEDWPAGNPSVF